MKGSLLDVIFIPVVLLALSAMIIVGALVLDGMGSALPTEAQPFIAQGEAAMQTFDYTFVIIAAALGIGSIALGFMYPSHPIFFVVGLIMMVISAITTPAVSNAFGTLVSSDAIASTAANYPIMTWFMENSLVLFALIIGAVLMIAMYTGWRSARA